MNRSMPQRAMKNTPIGGPVGHIRLLAAVILQQPAMFYLQNMVTRTNNTFEATPILKVSRRFPDRS